MVLQDTFSFGASTQNALAAGLVVGVMILPTIASISEDAMAAVPQGLREGAYGLGASRMQVAIRVVVPAALSGIVASIVLGVSRGIGETMIVLIAAGLQPNEGFNLLEGFETMTTFIAATGQGDIPTGSTEYKTIFAVGTILFVMTLVDEHDRDPLRPQVQAGVRLMAGVGMSPRGAPPARSARPASRPRRGTGRRARSRSSTGSSAASSAGLVVLAVILYDVVVRQDGFSTLFQTGFFTENASSVARDSGIQPGPDRDALADGSSASSSSSRSASRPRSTSRSTRTATAGTTASSS